MYEDLSSYIYNASTRVDGGDRVVPALADQPVQLNWQASGSTRDPVLKRKVELRRTPDINLCTPHVYTCTHTQAHEHMYLTLPPDLKASSTYS